MRNAYLLLSFFLAGCGASAHPIGPSGTASAPVAGTTTPRATFEESAIANMTGAFVGTMPVAITSFGAASIGEDVYVAGGYFGEPHRYSREGQSRSFARFHAGEWTALAPLATGLQGLTLVALGADLVRCGGNRIDNAAGADADMHSVAECARFNVRSGSWEEFPAMPSPRSSFDAAVVGGRIYAVGGWAVNGDTDSSAMRNTVAVWEPETNAWREVPAPFERRALAVVAVGNSVIALGGLDATLHASQRVDVFDTATGNWTRGPDLPSDGFGVAAAVIGSTVYASERDGVISSWSPGADAWQRVTSLTNPRFFHRVIADGPNHLLVVGGIGSMTTDGRARLIERAQVAGSMNERVRVSSVEISFPGEARNRSGAFVSDDSLWIYGGNNSEEQHDFEPANFERAAHRLHLPSLRWFPMAALPEGRQSMQTVVLGDRVLTFGGFGHDEDAPRTFNNGFMLNPETAEWTTVANVLPSPRTQFAAAVYGNAIWVVGGLDYDQARARDDVFRHLSSVLRCPFRENASLPAHYEIQTCEEIAAPLPGTRRAFESTLVGHKLYVVGGMREDFAGVDDCFAFDLDARTWAPFACPSRARVSADLVSVDGKLVLLGGSSRGGGGLEPDNRVEVFDIATGTWSVVIDALPFSTHQMRFFANHDRIIGFSSQPHAHRALVAWIDVAH
ncbi:MAG: hypothetical protein IPK60_07585 [Sandaracinaceae bacterium]|nr:hypothetical protein [Sandaracinaceae bacterium]